MNAGYVNIRPIRKHFLEHVPSNMRYMRIFKETTKLQDMPIFENFQMTQAKPAQYNDVLHGRFGSSGTLNCTKREATP
jgi:hypothetical protein